MDWRALWDRNAQKADVHAQVSRFTDKGVTDEHLNQITSHIAKSIDLRSEDRLLDLCCGNGVLSIRLAKYCRSVIGIDFSPKQIENARKHQSSNVSFLHGDALKLEEFVDGHFDKIVCHFSFQYFDTYRKGFIVLKKMKNVLAPGGCIFLGDIPDFDKKNTFFPLLIPRLRHEVRKILGREPMGKFWKKSTLNKMASKLELKGKVMNQPSSYLYAHYRFDYLLKKEGKLN